MLQSTWHDFNYLHTKDAYKRDARKREKKPSTPSHRIQNKSNFVLLSSTFHTEFTFMANVLFTFTTHSIAWHFSLFGCFYLCVCTFLSFTFFASPVPSLCYCHPSFDCDITKEFNIILKKRIETAQTAKAKERTFTIVSDSYVRAYHEMFGHIKCHSSRRASVRARNVEHSQSETCLM